jgi:serine/threonine-protein kinase
VATTTTGGPATAQERIARHRHAAEILRARGVLLVGCSLWLLVGGGLDLYAHPRIGHGSLLFVLAVRGAVSAFHAVALSTLYRDPLPPPSVTGPLMASVFPVTALGLTVIAVPMGGLTSPYVTAIFVIVMVQSIATPGPWRTGGVLAAVTTAIYPAGMLLATTIDDTARAQLDDPVAVTYFTTFVAVLGAGAIVVAWGGHIVWSLRRSVFETRNLGRYRLLRRIGKGGMGEVWRAHDRALRRDVALKILSPEHGRSPTAITRFEREIQATAALVHPNIVRIHDWGVTDDGVWYYAMDLLEGTDLGSLVKRFGTLPPALVVHLGTQAAHALAEAHARGVIHRDVKPGNVFVVTHADELEQVRLLDFGVARLDEDSGGLTNAGAIIGTPGFIAPEVLAGAAAGVSADVYGLAATVFHALTGKTPRDAGPGVPPSALVKGIPAELDDVLVRALDGDPARRHRGADELAIDLGATSLAGVWAGGLAVSALAEPHVSHDATLDADAPRTRDEAPRGRAS